MNSMLSRPLRVNLCLLFFICVQDALAQHVNPKQAEVDALNDEKALLEARSGRDKAAATSIADRFPGFGNDFGKQGTLTIDSAERDKFHVTARAAEAFTRVADRLAVILSDTDGPSVLLTDADRNALPVYSREYTRLLRLATDVRALLGPTLTPEAIPAAGLLSVGSLVSELAQFTQLVRTDKSVAFANTDLADDVLLDQIVVAAKGKLIYPASVLDSLLNGNYPSEFAKALREVTKRRTELLAAKAPKLDKAKSLLSEINSLSEDLTAQDANTKFPLLMTAMRGEVVNAALIASSGQVFSVTVAAKGGSSLKVSSIWRSDRLYAAGGVVASYRLVSGGPTPKILKAGVIAEETAYKQIPLN